MAGPTSSNSRPGLPTWARQNANYAFGMDTDPNTGLPTGFLGQAEQGANAFPWANILSSFMGPMNAANLGGSDQRQLASQLTGQALPGTQQIAGASLGGAGMGQDIMNMIPGMLQASQTMAQNFNRGAGGLQNAMGAAGQTLQNVMNPTAYNPMFQNAMQNQITPTINASMASRGLGSSGAGVDAISRAGQDLSNQFATRQFGEQLQAGQNLGNIGGQLGQLGIAGAQLPGQVFGQFMSGLGQGQNNLATAMQNQLGPLGALTAGSQQFWQGVNNPLSSIGNISQQVYSPLANVQSGVLGALGTISGPHIGPMQTALGK